MADRFQDADDAFPDFAGVNPFNFITAPNAAYSGRYAPQTATPGVLTEEDAYRQNYARDREVMDALQMGWYAPRGGGITARTAVDYAPSRLTKGAERDIPRKNIFENASGIFPDFDAAAPKSGLRNMLEKVFGTPPKRAERRAREPWAPFVDPVTNVRYQTWPEQLVRSAATLPHDVFSGAVPAGPSVLGQRREDYTDIPGDAQPADTMMERAQDLAGVMGGGPLTERPNAATLASGAKRPTIGDAAMTRRGLFDAFRSTPETAVAEPRAPLDVGQNAPTPNLPAVQDPLARLIGGGEAPKSKLLEELNTRPAQPELPHAELTDRLVKALNPEMDRRTMLRGAASVAANASRLGKVGEMLAKPAEAVAAPKPVIPKLEEIWTRPAEEAWEALNTNTPVEENPRRLELERERSNMFRRKNTPENIKRMQEIHDELEALPANKPNIRKEVEEDFLTSNDMTKREAMREFGGKEGYEEQLKEHYMASDAVEDWTKHYARYEDYQLPGGENYRELLLKHPQGEMTEAEVKNHFDTNYNWEGKKPEWESLSKFAQDQWRIDAKHNRSESQDFHSSSWDEPNVLGHLRMHDRNIPGVGKSLHLEELNSEWHQEGGRKGYKAPVDTTGWTAQRAAPVKGSSIGWEVKDKDGKHVFTGAGYGVDDPKAVIEMAARYVTERQVPHAPLKTEWPEHFFRRAVKEAVEQGHDAVSWTPGEHQAERYHGGPPEAPQGLRDFYDKHLVDVANKVGKEFGTKVEQRRLKPVGDATLSPHDQAINMIKEEFENKWAGKPIKSSGRIVGGWDQEKAKFLDSTEGRNLYDKFIKKASGKKSIDSVFESGGGQSVPDTQVPVFRITPQLRKAVKDGSFSLLSDSGKPGAPLAALENVGKRGVKTDTGPRYEELWRIAARRNLTEAENNELAALQERRNPRGLSEVPRRPSQDPTEAALQAIHEALRLHPDSGVTGERQLRQEFDRQNPNLKEDASPAYYNRAFERFKEQAPAGPLGGLPGARAAFDQHIGKYIPEKEFQEKFFSGMHHPDTRMNMLSNKVLEFDGPLQENGQRVGHMKRSIDFKNGIAHHDLLSLNHDQQGSGVAKKLLKDQVELYHRLGLDSVETYANISVGSYAWAKYGFTPDQASWNHTRQVAAGRLSNLERQRYIDKEDAAMLQKVLANKDPRAIWDLVDHRGTTKTGEPIAKELMMNNGWNARLDLYDQDAMNRFHSYVSKKKDR